METSGFDTSIVRTVGYSYDPSGRLDTITDGSQNHVYTYQPNSSLVSTINSRTGSSSWFRESRYYDTQARLLGIRSDRMNGTTLTAEISAHAYDYDALNRRTKNTFQDGSTAVYGYNDRSEVLSSTRKNAAGTAIPQLDTSYTYDGIGNRLTSNSPVLGNHTYTPNNLNQYASITTSNGRTAIGRAPAAWTIKVAGVDLTSGNRIGEIYWRDLTATNTTAPVWQGVVTSKSDGTLPTTKYFWYAKTPTVPSYDADGNLTNDGRWIYTWDAENRLILMETTPAATTVGHPYTKLKFVYDWQGHRIARTVWQGGSQASPIFKSNRSWLYDGWNVIAEFSGTSAADFSSTRLNTFTWGLDLSSTLQGAGGVGGLLVQTTVSGGAIERASYDGNGNIVAWTKSSQTSPTSRREYDAFGNTLVSEGAAPCSFGFSTKMQDVETGLYYYGYRYYDPSTGRWPSRDPIEEEGGLNLYNMVMNNPLNHWDLLGNKIITNEEESYRDKVKDGLQKIAGGKLKWMCKPFKNLEIKDFDEKKAWVLTVVEPGSGDLWDNLNKGFGSNPVIVMRQGTVKDNAAGATGDDPRNVFLNGDVNIQVPLDSGKKDSLGDPIYQLKRQTFETVLWHELVGHSILEQRHPKQPWNTYQYKNTEKNKPAWVKGDPTLAIENQARTKLEQPQRRPQYWDTKEDWYK